STAMPTRDMASPLVIGVGARLRGMRVEESGVLVFGSLRAEDQNPIAALELPGRSQMMEGDPDRCAPEIADSVRFDEALLLGYPKLSSEIGPDATIDLMRYHPLDRSHVDANGMGRPEPGAEQLCAVFLDGSEVVLKHQQIEAVSRGGRSRSARSEREPRLAAHADRPIEKRLQARARRP